MKAKTGIKKTGTKKTNAGDMSVSDDKRMLVDKVKQVVVDVVRDADTHLSEEKTRAIEFECTTEKKKNRCIESRETQVKNLESARDHYLSADVIPTLMSIEKRIEKTEAEIDYAKEFAPKPKQAKRKKRTAADEVLGRARRAKKPQTAPDVQRKRKTPAKDGGNTSAPAPKKRKASEAASQKSVWERRKGRAPAAAK
jgi:hypothetical protein